jgi:HEAT repeat protein
LSEPTLDERFARLRAEAVDAGGAPDAYWALVESLWGEDPKEVWARLAPLADEADPRLQQLVPDVLSQLGFEAQPLFFETLEVFHRLVSRGPGPEVLAAVAEAAARFHDPSLVTLLAPHARHPDRAVREAVLHAIRRSAHPSALEALLHLSTDEDPGLREWATFALGSQEPLVDGPAVREALAARLTDPHGPTRDEALVGLALRRDPRALGPLRAQLEQGFVGRALFDAARALASPLLWPALEALEQRAGALASLEDEDRAALAAAVLACAPARADA